jgi:hypothetical protein
MKTTILILLISLFVFVTGCDYNCPGFDKDLLVWMPYETGDELVYINQRDDTLTFTINQKEISEPYETSHKNRNYCVSNAMFYATDHNMNGVSTEIINDRDYLSVSVSAKVNDNSGLDYLKIEDIASIIQQYTIASKLYEEVLIFEKDTITNDDEIWKIILAKNYGIIQFHDRETNDVWTLKHEQSR